VIRLLGSFLTIVGLAGFAVVMTAPRLPASVVEPMVKVVQPISALVLGHVPTASASPADAATPISSPITRLVIDSIGLDTSVVPAPMVEHDGLRTWDVPRFVAGQAEGSAGAGELGNAVVIGHLTSLTLGHVFEYLDAVSPGDLVSVFSSEQRFDYRVASVHDVARTDVAVVDPSTTPTLTLITCSGLWLPTVGDYNQRLVVTAELIS